MKKFILVSLLIVSLCGCSVQQKTQVKAALGDALTIGNEVQKMEQEKCDAGFAENCEVAAKVKTWVDAGQQIYDSDAFESNCDLMLSVTDIAYVWLAENYPDKPYRIFMAVLKARLQVYCQGGE